MRFYPMGFSFKNNHLTGNFNGQGSASLNSFPGPYKSLQG